MVVKISPGRDRKRRVIRLVPVCTRRHRGQIAHSGLRSEAMTKFREKIAHRLVQTFNGAVHDGFTQQTRDHTFDHRKGISI